MTDHKNAINPALRKTASILREKTLREKTFVKYKQRGSRTPAISKMELCMIIVIYFIKISITDVAWVLCPLLHFECLLRVIKAN